MKEDENKKPQWTKDNGEKSVPFDFEDFLGEDPKPTETGRDAARRPAQSFGDEFLKEEPDGELSEEPEAREQTTAIYPDRGRHEAPGAPDFTKTPEPQQNELPPSPPASPAGPASPPPVKRPTEAEPRPRIFVTPPETGSPPAPERRGAGETVKWIAAGLAAVAAVVLLIVILRGVKPAGNDASPSASPFATVTPGPTAAPTGTPAPQTPQPTIAPTTASVTVTAGKGGTISPNGTVTVNEGESASFTITPDEGYVLSQLLADGVSVDPTGSYTFTKLSGSHTLYAVFALKPQPTAEPTIAPTPAPTQAPTIAPTQTPTEPPQTESPSEPPAQPSAEGNP